MEISICPGCNSTRISTAGRCEECGWKFYSVSRQEDTDISHI